MADEKRKGKIRAARLDKSERLQRVFWLLADGREHSTWEIVGLKVAAVNSAIAELKADGVNDLTIRHRHRDGGNWYQMQRDAKFYQWRRVLQEQAAELRRA